MVGDKWFCYQVVGFSVKGGCKNGGVDWWKCPPESSLMATYHDGAWAGQGDYEVNAATLAEPAEVESQNEPFVVV